MPRESQRFPRRTSLLGVAAALLLLVATIAIVHHASGRVGPSRTSIGHRRLILVCLDTVRYDAFWLPGKARPPDEFSAWADKAIRFTNVQSAAPWTIPSVSSVMTGLYPIQHGAGHFSTPVRNLAKEVPAPLSDDLPTLASRFVALGVPTYAVVAHPWFKPQFGLGNGFPEIIFQPRGSTILRIGEQWLDHLLGKRRDSDFFLYLHFMEAHQEHRSKKNRLEEILAASPASLRSVARRASPAGICSRAHRTVCQRYQVYVAAIAQERAYLAHLLDFLAKRGLLASTTLMVYSDHGEEFHEHLKQERKMKADPRGLYGTGHGQSLYQELLHVPVLIWRPGTPGRDVPTPVSLVAFPHLLSRWFRLSLPEVPGLGSPTVPAESQKTQPLFSSGIAYGPPAFSVKLGHWKLVQYPTEGVTELFDLAQDPGEQRPVNAPKREQALAALIARYRKLPLETQAHPPQLDAERVEQLKALGYLTGLPDPSQASDGRVGQ